MAAIGTPHQPVAQSVKKKIRVRKADSAFVYCILEATEGVAAYSTLDGKVGDLHRDIELLISPDFVVEAERMLASLGEKIHAID